jgi:ABC-2 type transport system ATP-binding protein
MQLLKANALTKDFGNKKGIFDINFSLSTGEIVGFVGPNGAGKSTAINILGGFVLPDSGQVEIFGQKADYSNIYKFYDRIGILLSETVFEKNLTPLEIFIQSTKLLKSQSFDKSKCLEIADYLELDVHKKFAELSFGNRKKVGLINTLLHNPELIILDEPSGGLDPLIQQRMFELLKQIASRGGSVLLSSHILSEVQSACHKVIMIKQGKIILQDSTQNILDKAKRVFRLRNPDKNIVEQLNNQSLVSKMEQVGENVLLYTDNHERILQFLIPNGFYDFYLESPNLEDMFMEYYKSESL